MQMLYRISYQCNNDILMNKTILQDLKDKVSNTSHHGLGEKRIVVSPFCIQHNAQCIFVYLLVAVA